MKYLFVLFLLSIAKPVLFAQSERPIEERLLMKNPDDILKKTLGNQGKAMLNKTNFLVMDNIVFNKRFRWFVGDKIKLKERKRKNKFEGEIAFVTDSSLIFSTYNDIMLRYDVDTIQIKNIQKIYIKRRIPFISPLLKLLPPYLAIVFGIKAITAASAGNLDTFNDVSGLDKGLAISGVLGIILTNQNFRINRNRPLKIFKSI